MFTISKDAYYFLVKAYENQVERFFDDPIGFSDGSDVGVVFDHLKSIGEELEIEIETLAKPGDIDNINELILGNTEWAEDIEDEYDIIYNDDVKGVFGRWDTW